MREIKFRAWDKFSKTMLATGFHVLGEVNCFHVIEQELDKYYNPKHPGLQRLKDVVLMQHTGLKDSKGVEIYEGDIVKVWQDWWNYSDYTAEELADIEGEPNDDFTIHQVKYLGDTGYPAYDLTPYVDVESNNLSHFLSGEEGTRLEVIGNKFENPELLEAEND